MIYSEPSLLKDRFNFISGGVQFDLPGAYTLEWSLGTVRERGHRVKEDPIPVLTGLAFAAAPYVVGAVGVAYAPLPLKPVFASMMIPTGVGEVFWFGVGYKVGEEIESGLYDGW